MEVYQAISLVLMLCAPSVSGYIQCGSYECHGDTAYCCILDDGDFGCCWDTYVYQLWWFWLIWVIVFFMILGCSLACWRRRRAQYRYVVMANSEYPTYGTVVHTSNQTMYGGYSGGPPPPGAAYPPTAPSGPPSYAASQATKPPSYS